MRINRGMAGGLVAVTSTAALVLPAGSARAAEVDLEARLIPTAAFSQVRGHAEFDQDGSLREFEVSIHHAGKLAGRVLTIRVHGAFVGRMRVRADGFAHLDRHSGVPAMSAGDVVRVRTGSGKLVTRGTLHHDANN